MAVTVWPRRWPRWRRSAPRPAVTLDPADVRIDGGRLLGRLDALAELGAIEGPDGTRGSARLALTDADREGRDLVVTWMRDLGLDVASTRSATSSPRGRHDPTRPPVMTGSHIDTVRTGGRYDGNLGVLAGLEVIETLEQHGVATRHPLAVAFFTNEEGSRFQPDMLGSLVYAGGLALEEALDIRAIDGPTLGDELARIGYAARCRARPAAPARLRRAAHRAGSRPRSRGLRHRRRRGRAGHLVARAHHRRPVEPRRHHADGDAPRRRLRRRRDRRFRAAPRPDLAATRSPRWARCRSSPAS